MSNAVLISIISMAGLGLFFATLLAVINQKLKVEEDPLIERIMEALPGVNCGACGFASCHQYAEAIVNDKVTIMSCRAGGESVSGRLSEILGVKAGEAIKELAFVHCGADESKRKKKASYTGIKSCVAAHNILGGEILCEYGCLGYGDCVTACPFAAIKMVNGLPRIDREKCTACGRCVIACPRNLISVKRMEQGGSIYVACKNQSKGAETRKVCPVGCIACGICQKLTNGVFYVENNLARTHNERLSEIPDKEEIMRKCPVKCITK
ncbi:MAG: RnfABCDGE type electron transport complex subunit B [Candidatus Omnitrophica bacterium]|nr:RnfABCDGE type electron transport complex subunit B [Candidatus Omnitrophota bacterium]